MGIGISLILIAAGAILTWAVTAEASGVDVNAVGVILMVVGIVGLLLSLVFWSSWGGFGAVSRRRTAYVEGDAAYRRDPAAAPRTAAPAERRTVVEEEELV
jgi:hypothetical protein